MTREEYEKIIDKKLKAVKEELMVGFKEEPSLDGWKVGDKYYFSNIYGEICQNTVTRSSLMNGEILDEVDAFMIRQGYAKRTEEEAEFQRERDAVLYELSKFAEPKDRSWIAYLRHYYICYDFDTKRIRININSICKRSDIYFASEEDAEEAIKEVGEHRIAKFYLGVDLNE